MLVPLWDCDKQVGNLNKKPLSSPPKKWLFHFVNCKINRTNVMAFLC